MTPEFCASRARAGVPAVGRNSPFTHVSARLIVLAAGKVKVGDALEMVTAAATWPLVDALTARFGRLKGEVA